MNFGLRKPDTGKREILCPPALALAPALAPALDHDPARRSSQRTRPVANS